MKTPEEIQTRLATLAHEYETASTAKRRDLNVERYTLQWVLGTTITKPKHLASKIVKNAMA